MRILPLLHLFSCFKKEPKLSELLLNKVGMKKTKEKVGNKIPQVNKTYFYGSLKILSPSSYFFSEQILGTQELILMFTNEFKKIKIHYLYYKN